MSNDELKAILDTQYEKVRQLEDGTFIGIHDLMFTRALHIDLDIHGWSRRYCYADRDLADVAFNTMTTSDDQPLSGFVASRRT